MRNRCPICGRKVNQKTGECTGFECEFIDPSMELQKEQDEKLNGKAMDKTKETPEDEGKPKLEKTEPKKAPKTPKKAATETTEK